MLISVGGAPAPLLFSLQRGTPAHVWYFCSPDSREIADEIHRQLDWHPDRDFIEAQQFEELGPCYRALRDSLPSLLRKWRVDPKDVLVDYTGGTKTMSAALVLAGSELFGQFAYIGGNQRGKGGLGITLNGQERALYQANPWSELAIREIERACDLWNSGLFEGSARVLRESAPRVPRRHAFETVAKWADSLAARHRLDFKRALILLGEIDKALPALYDGREDFGLKQWTRAMLQLCVACTAGKPSQIVIRELLDNSLRTAAQGRYDDACARLYRAMEMQGQVWLEESTHGAFVLGRKEPDHPLPSPLAHWPACHPSESGEVVLSLELLFQALALLDHPYGSKVTQDIALGLKSRWRGATSKRNHSILAHGIQPLGPDGFDQMKTLASEFLGFDLSREANPIPPLDARWLL